MPQVLTLSEARAVVARVLAEHGDEIDLRQLIAALPVEHRAQVTRYFAELRKSGAIQTTLSVKDGVVSHAIRKGEVSE